MTDANPEATRKAGASGWREQVQALKAELGRWEDVAVACNGKRLGHPGSYYQRIADGHIKTPHLAARNGIRRASKSHLGYALTAVNGTFKRDIPLGVSIRRPLGTAINQWRIERGMTWDQWHEKAHELMRREYP